MDAGTRNCLPGPNLSCYRIGDMNNKGMLAYGFSRHVVITKMMCVPTLFCGVKNVHSKITCVRFNPFHGYSLATAGTEEVKIWKLHGKELKLQMEQPFQQLSSIEWSSFQPHIIFVSQDNCITRWDIDEDIRQQFPCGDKMNYITIMAHSHLKPYLLAVGHRSGVISLLDIHFQLKRKLCGHQQRLTNISWCFNSNKLLTSSSDGTIRVWTIANTENEIDSSRVCFDWNRPRDSDGTPFAVWHPTKNNAILATTFSGSIGELDVNVEGELEIVIYANDKRPDNKEIFYVFSNQIPAFYTFSKDRILTLWDVREKAVVAEMNTLKNGVKSICFPPISTGISGILAIALYERSVIFWDTTSDSKVFKAKYCWKNVTSPIACLAWHPLNSDVIAFATADGSVAILEKWKNHQRAPLYCNLNHGGEVSSLCWGPCSQMTGSVHELALFSSGAGRILVHSMEKSRNFYEIISSEEKKRFSFVSWKDDFSFFATGSATGTVDIYNGKTYELYIELLCGSMPIQHLAWHPKFYLQDGNKHESSIHCWLAAAPVTFGMRRTEILLYEVSDELLQRKPFEKNIKALIDYSICVNCLSWSPYFEELLAAGSADCDVSVWNVVSCQLLCKFIGHFSSVLSIVWSPFDKNIVFCGSSASTLLSFDQHALRDQQRTGVCVRKNQIMLINRRGVIVDSDDESEEEATATEAKSPVPITQGSPVASEESHLAAEDGFPEVDEAVPEEPSADDSSTTIPEKCEFALPFLSSKFVNMRNEEVLSHIRMLDSYLAKGASNDPDGVGLKMDEGKLKYFAAFGDKEDILRMIEAESQNVSMTPSEKVEFDVWWKHNLGKLAEEIIESGMIPDNLFLHAPNVSRSLWQKVCEAYVKSPESEDSCYKKVVCLLALRKTKEAITFLKDKDIVCALMLARKFLIDEEDPLLNEVIESFKKQLLEGKFEVSENGDKLMDQLDTC